MGQDLGQEQKQLFENAAQYSRQPLKPLKPEETEGEKSKEAVRGRASAQTKPAHGKSKRLQHRTLVFFDFGTPEWGIYADDYEQKHGVSPMPTSHPDGGKGRWFFKDGETNDPKRLWTAERLARFG